MIDRFRESSIQRAILMRLRKGPSTPEALAAQTGVDLAWIRYTLRGLVALGRVIENGVLFELPPPRRAA